MSLIQYKAVKLEAGDLIMKHFLIIF